MRLGQHGLEWPVLVGAPVGRVGRQPLLNPTAPMLGRQVLKRLGVTKIVVTPSGDGAWDLDGGADLADLVGMSPVNHGAMGGPSRPPI